MHGKGKIKFLRDGIEYEGSFKNNSIEGYGTFKWKNGDIYEGQVKGGKMHGYGIYKYSNGKEYKGFFNKGVKDSDRIRKYEKWKSNGYGVKHCTPEQIYNNQNQFQVDNERQIRSTGINNQNESGMQNNSIIDNINQNQSNNVSNNMS